MPPSLVDRRPFLLARAAIARALRDYFHDDGFIEVEPPVRVPSPGGEAHLEAIPADGLYLHTSPEFAMKRMAAAGYEKIFYLGKVWRAGDVGRAHAEEFTMLEWYRVGAPYGAVQDDCIALGRLAGRALGADALTWRGQTWPIHAPVQCLTMAEAFARFAGVDLLAAIEDRAALAGNCARLSISVQTNDDAADLFAKLLSHAVEPQLAALGAVILDAYPIQQAALARPSPQDPRVAERFEHYVCGLELANGYGELTDPVEQRARFTAAMQTRADRGRTHWPLDETFLTALDDLGPTSGCALGFDRLVMLATGAPTLAHVLW
jgi:elongation factor P--(R)-beta-lysine ligase